MRKIKLCKRIIAFLLVLTFVLPGNSQIAYAQSNETAVTNESSTTMKDASTTVGKALGSDEEVVATPVNATKTVDATDIMNSVNTVNSEDYGVRVTLFDYDRESMNQATMNYVANKINNDIESGKVSATDLESKRTLRRLYPSMLFISSTIVGDASAGYDGGEVKATDFDNIDYCPFNKNNGNGKGENHRSCQGLVNDRLGENGLPVFAVNTTNLFDVNNSSIKKVYQNVDIPLINNQDGYLLFDSCDYQYKLNEDSGKYCLNIDNYNLENEGQGFGFLPFDESEKEGKPNYHFGMNFAVNFDMPENGMVNGEACTFEFSGDDDVWVYINGKLALELGGMHGRCDGKIDFTNGGSVTYNEPTKKTGDKFYKLSSPISFETLGIDLKDTDNSLEVFYVERGASESNCKIRFNMPTTKKPIDVEDLLEKTAKLDNWQDRTYDISLNVKSNTSNENVNATVIDIVDSRFKLANSEEIDKLINSGANISVENDETIIRWDEVQNIENGWSISFKIKAKDSYVGGNDVDTNVYDGPNHTSEVIFKDTEGNIIVQEFPKPKVNVRIDMQAGWTKDEIFLGQSLERYFNQNQFDKMLGNTKGIDKYIGEVTGVLEYSWYEDGSLKVGSCNDFSNYIRSLSPRLDTQSESEELLEEKMQGEPECNPYKVLYITFKPIVSDDSQKAEAAADSMKQKENDPAYTACMADANDETINDITVHGRYYITIIDGNITVNKTYDHGFLTDLIYSNDEIEAIDARQTAAFTIYKYAETATVDEISNGTAEILDTYNITITGDGNQIITGLEAGMYRVVENTNWTWKYNATVQEANDSTTDGIFYIGKQSPNASVVNSEAVSFENKLDRELSKIYSDTTNILNSFIGN